MRYTATISDRQVDFLDTTVKINPVYTTLYTKPTDTHDYLLYSSGHPRHCKGNTPYSQLMRIGKICTKDAYFISNAQMIFGNFHRRGYVLELLKTSWEKGKNLNRDALIKPNQIANTPTQNTNFYLTTTYNPGSQDKGYSQKIGIS